MSKFPDGAVRVDRRRFIGAGAMIAAAAELGLVQRARAQSRQEPAPNTLSSGIGKEAHAGALRQIEAGTLNVGFIDAGPGDGPAVLLLHGWPYDSTAMRMSRRSWWLPVSA